MPAQLRVLLAAVGISLALSPWASASRGSPLGLGVIFGEPTGFTAKFWQGQDHAYDAGFAYSFGSFVEIYGDYLWHFDMSKGKTGIPGQLSPYLGVGGVFLIAGNDARLNQRYFADRNSTSVGLGVRFPIGIEWLPGKPPLGVFLELVPGMGVVPGIFGFVQGGLGFRYYF